MIEIIARCLVSFVGFIAFIYYCIALYEISYRGVVKYIFKNKWFNDINCSVFIGLTMLAFGVGFIYLNVFLKTMW